MFQPTLLAFTRSDNELARVLDGDRVSTHAPRVHEERHQGAPLSVEVARVSTHAPRVHEERPVFLGASSVPMLFQPTLLAFTRSDRAWMRKERGFLVFQPTLLAFTRSDDGVLGVTLLDPVSTHAPRVHEERHYSPRPSANMPKFQPTLLAFTRSDRHGQQPRCSRQVSTHAPRVHEERPDRLNVRIPAL
ncbi:Transketolase [Myxococcus hansupus]|uniref:Transketolase n=1 Tax=Pseudomyxococcus hansupus TaxID=1297742 RepID=A0A0H4X9E3_9BACT|nr:Transketolase [Myxococcus hansupus]